MCKEKSARSWAHAKKGIALTGANNDASVLLNVDFFARVLEPKPAARDRRDDVVLVVHSGEIGDLGVKVRRPGGVAHARRSERDASDRSSSGEVKPHEDRIEFRERSAERVTDLHRGKNRVSRVGTTSRWVTTILLQVKETHEDDVCRGMLGHQTLHLCEDLARRLLVLERKAGVDLDVAGNVGEEVGVGFRELEVYVG